MKISTLKTSPLHSGDHSFFGQRRFNKPSFAESLKFPDDLTQLTPANISDLHGKYTQMYVWANQEATFLAVSILREETTESREVQALSRRRPGMNSLEKWRRDNVISAEPPIEACRLRIRSHRAERELVLMFQHNYEKYMAALSRELTRRGFDSSRYAG